MIVPYTKGDLGYSLAPGEEDTIAFFKYARTKSYNWTTVQQEVDGCRKAADWEGKKKPSYRHYVPYSRILRHLTTSLQNLPRELVKARLMDFTNHLYIEEDDRIRELKESGTRCDFDVYVEWAIEAICDYPENIYYGVGSGDNRGTTLDVPPSKETQLRVNTGAKELNKVTGLDISKEVVGKTSQWDVDLQKRYKYACKGAVLKIPGAELDSDEEYIPGKDE